MNDTTKVDAPKVNAEAVAPEEAANAMFGGAASFASAESIEILNLLGNDADGGSCCGGGCCSTE